MYTTIIFGGSNMKLAIKFIVYQLLPGAPNNAARCIVWKYIWSPLSIMPLPLQSNTISIFITINQLKSSFTISFRKLLMPFIFV